MAKPYKLNTHQDRAGQWSWEVVTTNGDVLKAKSHATLRAKSDCIRSIERILNPELVEMPAKRTPTGPR